MRLYINVDHVATVRQARRTFEPDPLELAHLCMRGGADGITVHLREDRRHIQDHDVRRLADSSIPVLNLELATAPDIVRLASQLAPYQVTIVPEKREEITTEGGLDLRQGAARTKVVADRLSDAGSRVSLFVDPDPESIDLAAEMGVDAVELHTGEYSNSPENPDPALERLRLAAKRAAAAGLAVHAGHGLRGDNVVPVAEIAEIEELNIGHHIVSRALTVGMQAAVREMRGLIDSAR